MRTISFSQKGGFQITDQFLKKMAKWSVPPILAKYGAMGVMALKNATPKDTGETADSWEFKVVKKKNGGYSLNFYNKKTVEGARVAILLQYGHVSVNGGWVAGRDYINPALASVFDGASDAIWKEVTVS